MNATGSRGNIGWLDREPEYWDLVSELLELRRLTAETVGRRQYAYRVLDDAVESGSSHSMRKARDEVYQIDLQLCDQIVEAAGQTC